MVRSYSKPDWAHDFPYQTVAIANVGKVQVCRKCGVARHKYHGIFHYYSSYEHLGTGIRCNDRVWKSCGRGFDAKGNVLDAALANKENTE